MEMMAAPRNDALPGELERDSDFSALSERLPEVAEKLGEDLMWTNEAEEVLIEKMWEKP